MKFAQIRDPFLFFLGWTVHDLMHLLQRMGHTVIAFAVFAAVIIVWILVVLLKKRDIGDQ